MSVRIAPGVREAARALSLCLKRARSCCGVVRSRFDQVRAPVTVLRSLAHAPACVLGPAIITCCGPCKITCYEFSSVMFTWRRSCISRSSRIHDQNP